MSRTSVREARRSVGLTRHAVDEPHGEPRAIGAHEVDVERLRVEPARTGSLMTERPSTSRCRDIGSARLELGEVDADPLGERGVQIADAPVRLEREEAGRA